MALVVSGSEPENDAGPLRRSVKRQHEAVGQAMSDVVARASASAATLRKVSRGQFPQRTLTDEEKLILLHRRLGLVNVKELVAAFMRMRFTGYPIPRQMLGERALLKLAKCDSCGMCKHRRSSYHHNHADAGEVMCMDIHVFLNCAAYYGTKCMVKITDLLSHATFSYSVEQLLECLDLVLFEYHMRHSLPPLKILSIIKKERYRVMRFTMHNVQYIASPTDVPELNGIAKLVNGWLGKMTMLHYSSIQPPFWTDAYTYAAQIKYVLPLKTQKDECRRMSFLRMSRHKMDIFECGASRRSF